MKVGVITISSVTSGLNDLNTAGTTVLGTEIGTVIIVKQQRDLCCHVDSRGYTQPYGMLGKQARWKGGLC